MHVTPDDFEPNPTAPETLTDPAARDFFDGVMVSLADRGLAPDPREEALILACAEQIQHVHALAAAITETGYMSVGSMGQPVANPLLAVHSNAVNALNALLFKAKGIIPADAAPKPALRIVKPRRAGSA